MQGTTLKIAAALLLVSATYTNSLLASTHNLQNTIANSSAGCMGCHQGANTPIEDDLLNNQHEDQQHKTTKKNLLKKENE